METSPNPANTTVDLATVPYMGPSSSDSQLSQIIDLLPFQCLSPKSPFHVLNCSPVITFPCGVTAFTPASLPLISSPYGVISTTLLLATHRTRSRRSCGVGRADSSSRGVLSRLDLTAVATESHVTPVLTMLESSLRRKISTMTVSRVELGYEARRRQSWEQYFWGVEMGARCCLLAEWGGVS
jgi:hypothetical protein